MSGKNLALQNATTAIFDFYSFQLKMVLKSKFNMTVCFQFVFCHLCTSTLQIKTKKCIMSLACKSNYQLSPDQMTNEMPQL